MKCYDRLSGETFIAHDEAEIRRYIADGLNERETVAYDVVCDDTIFFDGEISADDA